MKRKLDIDIQEPEEEISEKHEESVGIDGTEEVNTEHEEKSAEVKRCLKSHLSQRRRIQKQ